MFCKKAILIIHGFAGGTYDLEDLANFLEYKRGFDVFTFTLPGHSVRLRENANCDKWIEASEKQVQSLIKHGYNKIFVIGHSMGGVIATYLATKYKEIKRLVLMAASFTCLALEEDGKFSPLAALKKTPSLLKTYSHNEFFARVMKLPIASLKEFIRLVIKYRYTSNLIEIPTLIIHGTNDDIVPKSSSVSLFDKIPTKKKQLIIVKKATHDILHSSKNDDICFEIEKFLTIFEFNIKKIQKEL